MLPQGGACAKIPSPLVRGGALLVLGLETSCDETAAAVVEGGRRVLSDVVSSQAGFFADYGGVVPELAGRNHAVRILPVVRESLKAAGVGYGALGGVAATYGPGLTGALLVGLGFGKALAAGLGVPFVGVNHLAAHLQAPLLGEDPPEPPFVGLLVSGGHTALYEVLPGEAGREGLLRFRLLGETLDDAAGEAYDKVGRLLGVPYPAGAVLDELARSFSGEPERFTRPLPEGLDFSFSGLKTAAARRVVELAGAGLLEERRSAVAAGFQAAVIEILTEKALAACRETCLNKLVVGGGVAANRGLRGLLDRRAPEEGVQVRFAPLEYTMDNAAMVAARGYFLLNAGVTGSLDLEAVACLELGVNDGG
jgi:N6-L-threonylcarbamoyladenine synthase